MDMLQSAVTEFILREQGYKSPVGFKDSGGRWFPRTSGVSEHRECCDKVRQPTRAFPYSLYKHCMSLKHVAAIFEVDAKDLRRAMRPENLLTLMGLDPRIDEYIAVKLKGARK